jgi:hypothetical protein
MIRNIENQTKLTVIFTWVVCLCGIFTIAHAQPAQTWKTGQTVSYATGDDGAVEAGVAWPSPRFTDNGDGTVTDNLTRLVWLKNANCFGGKTWSQALSACNTLASGSCGLSDGSVPGDWVLPNRKQLLSLVDYSRYGPALPQGYPFQNVLPSYYWSATANAYNADYAWGVRMRFGFVHLNAKSYDSYVWPVRAGQCGPFDPLKINTTVLPAAEVTVAYQASVRAACGVTPYCFSILSGSLPPGLSLNTATGLISGTPPLNTCGVYNFTVRVEDSAQPPASATRAFSITVTAPGDSDCDGLADGVENGCCTLTNDPDTDKDGLWDGVEDNNDNCEVDPGETDPCDWDTDSDGLSDGEEDVNKNGIQDAGETNPLDDDSDNDGYKDGVEKDIGTNPLNANSWPCIICIGTCDGLCDACAADIPDALTMMSQAAAINYLKIRNANIQESGLSLTERVKVGIESGKVGLQP